LIAQRLLDDNDRANAPGSNPGRDKQRAAGWRPGPWLRPSRPATDAARGTAGNQKDDAQVASNNTVAAAWTGCTTLTSAAGEQVDVHFSPMVPCGFGPRGEWLLVARLVRIADRQACQGILLDGARLQTLLASEVGDLLPGSVVCPVPEEGSPSDHTVRTMTALPFQLDPGADAARVPAAGWTPLRVSLVLAWAAALVALAAVGLGGWSLLDLSARRIRFVSAVTHELRTLLTTLRLYSTCSPAAWSARNAKREEYLHTLHAETERSTAWSTTFSTTPENQRPRGVCRCSSPTWSSRCGRPGTDAPTAARSWWSRTRAAGDRGRDGRGPGAADRRQPDRERASTADRRGQPHLLRTALRRAPGDRGGRPRPWRPGE
jgi:hypothetical protein